MPSAARTPPDPPPPRRHLAAVPDERVPDERGARLGHVVDRLRRRIRVCDVAPFDGMVWLAHLGADGKPRLFSRVSDPVVDLDELYLLDLLSTLGAIGLPGVVVAIWRGDGQPAAVDRRLARDLGRRLGPDGPTILDAVLVVSPAGYRLVRGGRAARRAGQPAPNPAAGAS
jgi:hypothetical protein